MLEPDEVLRRRKSLRDPRIDYTRGNYFVTVCLQQRLPRFGRIVEGKLEPNAAGKMIESVWLALPQENPGLILDCHIVMPDHFHAVLGIVEPRSTHPGHEVITRPHLSDILRNFKRLTTLEYGVGVKQGLWAPYTGKLWQPGFWDHQLRGEDDLQYHRDYVVNNPQRWQLRRDGLL